MNRRAFLAGLALAPFFPKFFQGLAEAGLRSLGEKPNPHSIIWWSQQQDPETWKTLRSGIVMFKNDQIWISYENGPWEPYDAKIGARNSWPEDPE